jgi:hypothetical protein
MISQQLNTYCPVLQWLQSKYQHSTAGGRSDPKRDASRGVNRVIWAPQQINAGIYLYRVKYADQVFTGKVIFRKQ